MKIIYCYILIISLSIQHLAGQAKTVNKTSRMLEFLLDNGEIDTSGGDDLNMYRNSIYEHVIYSKKQNCTITIFGTLSPHSGRYIALEDLDHVTLLKTSNLTSEMNVILSFLKKHEINKPSVIKVLFAITAAYQYNVELEKRLFIRPPGG